MANFRSLRCSRCPCKYSTYHQLDCIRSMLHESKSLKKANVCTRVCGLKDVENSKFRILKFYPNRIFETVRKLPTKIACYMVCDRLWCALSHLDAAQHHVGCQSGVVKFQNVKYLTYSWKGNLIWLFISSKYPLIQLHVSFI